MTKPKFVRFVEIRPGQYGYTSAPALGIEGLTTVYVTVDGEPWEVLCPADISLAAFIGRIDGIVGHTAHVTDMEVER